MPSMGKSDKWQYLNPDEVSRLVDRGQSFCVCFVGGFVSQIIGIMRSDFVCDVLPENVVEKRPEG